MKLSLRQVSSLFRIGTLQFALFYNNPAGFPEPLRIGCHCTAINSQHGFASLSFLQGRQAGDSPLPSLCQHTSLLLNNLSLSKDKYQGQLLLRHHNSLSTKMFVNFQSLTEVRVLHEATLWTADSWLYFKYPSLWTSREKSQAGTWRLQGDLLTREGSAITMQKQKGFPDKVLNTHPQACLLSTTYTLLVSYFFQPSDIENK